MNRLRWFTIAIKHEGANQVSIITSTAERQAAIEFAKAAAMRPRIVGEALQKISTDREILDTMFEILEMQSMIEGQARVTFVPPRSELLSQLLVADSPQATSKPPPPLKK